MDCHSNHSVFLRSDGTLACWDDGGSRLTLARFDPAVDYSRDVVFGKVFGGIRDSLRGGDMPFPDFCRDCLVLASGACFNPGWAARKEILIFQVEPSIACTLECPGCMTFGERKARHARPWNLDIAVFEKYLSDFRNDGVTIRTIDFQGHGEPLLNRDVWKMAGLAKSYFPQATISMCTNAHGRYEPSQARSGIDEMMFAIDGVDQQSFEPNRVRGSFDKAYGYMKAFCQGAAAEGRDIRTIWKYILFDCNNAPEQFVRAQELAVEAGVGTLLFVNTQLGLRSSRLYTPETIPRIDSGVEIRVSGYFSSFHDTLHAVDKARHCLSRRDAAGGASHLLFAANMIRRRFECYGEADAIPEDYQALIHEILDLAGDPQVGPDTRATIAGGLHALSGKLVIGLLDAKDRIIGWKNDEILRLSDQLRARPRRGVADHARTILRDLAWRPGTRGAGGALAARNRTIARQSDEIFRLAVRIGASP
jgi:hypothetical protein